MAANAQAQGAGVAAAATGVPGGVGSGVVAPAIASLVTLENFSAEPFGTRGDPF